MTIRKMMLEFLQHCPDLDKEVVVRLITRNEQGTAIEAQEGKVDWVFDDGRLVVTKNTLIHTGC